MRGLRGLVVAFALATALGIAFSGCGEKPTPEAETVVPGEVQDWILQDEAVMSLGTMDGAEEQQFHNIRGLAFATDTTVVVADDSRTLRIFHIEGRHLRTFGTEGEGPGEFRFISQLSLDPDGRLAVFDSGTRRITRFDTLGRLLETVRLADVRLERPLAFGPDGTVHGIRLGLPEYADEAIAFRDSVALVRFSREGQIVDSLGPFPGASRLAYQDGSRPAPMAPQTYIVGWNGGVVVSVGDEARVEVIGGSGGGASSFHLPGEAVPVTPQILAAWEREEREWMNRIGIPESVPTLPERYRELWPDVLPSYRLVLSDGDCLWFQRYPVPGADSVTWDIVHPRTGYYARLSVPKAFAMGAVRGDLLAIMTRDELEVQHVQVWRVEGPQNSCFPS